MAEKPAQSEAAPPEVPAKAARGKMLWIVVAAVMAAEGVGVFFAAKMLSGSPEAASASQSTDAHAQSSGADHGESGHATQPTKPDPGHGAEAAADHSKGSAHGTAEPSMMMSDSSAEVKLAECKTFNKETGKLVLFHIRVSVLVASTEADRARKLVEAKQARIEDRVNTVIRSAEPRHLNEPGLETLKRRLKFELDRIFEDPRLVQEVLIPYLVQSGSGL